MNPRRLVKEKLRGDSPPASENPTPAIRHALFPMAILLRRQLLSLCVLAVLSAGASAWAQDPSRDRGGQGMQDNPRREEPQRGERGDRQRGGSLADSVRRFERASGDRVLSAERMQADGRDVNRIKAMDDRGRVRVFVDDPQQRQRQQPPRGERTRSGDD